MKKAQIPLKIKSPIPFTGEPFTGLVTTDGVVIPFEYTNWREELDSMVTTAYLGAAIADENFSLRVKGEGATDFLKKYVVNDMDNAPIGKSKHAMLLNEIGNIAKDGVVLRLAEDEYFFSCFYPLLKFYLDKEHENGNFLNVTATFEDDTFVMYQIGGPKSLEVLEAAAKENLHDIEYLHFRNTTIAGHTVRVFRLGMAGTLSYEVHTTQDVCLDVYEAIYEAGQKYNIKKLGYHAYMMNHTENGFEQAGIHFMYDYSHIPGFFEWCEKNAPWYLPFTEPPQNMGSADDDINIFYVSPFDIGWDYLINYNHDFPGKEAALAAKEQKHKVVVSLEWNAEDVGDVFASQFREGTPYQSMEDVNDYLNFDFYAAHFKMHADKVVNEKGELIGISSGRGQVHHYQRMISIASIEPEYAINGTEVTVIWGNKNYPKKKIRAKVAPFPYLKETLNKDYDVSKVPFGHQ